MGDFNSSTHLARWLFTSADLAEKYQAANERAARTLKEYGSTRLEVELDGSVVPPGKQIDAEENASERHVHLPKPLSVEEELLLRTFYERKIQQVCRAFKFPHKIQATAKIYFKRFYLKWSVMEHDPKHIMLTCIYTSCKVEEFHVSAEEIAKGIRHDHQVILRNEMLVLQGLGFDLIVYSPYCSIDGFVDDIEIALQPKGDSLQKLKDLGEAAKFETENNMLADAPLIFPPGQLALAALRRVNKEERACDFDRYLKIVCSRHRNSFTEREFINVLNDIDAMVIEHEFINVLDDIDAMVFTTPISKDIRHADKKLKRCRNLGLQDKIKKREKKKHKSKQTPNDTQAINALSQAT